MMKIFDQFLHLTPFAEYLEFMFTKRRMLVVASRLGAKVMHMQLAQSELLIRRTKPILTPPHVLLNLERLR
jgi:hypothetical protein